MFIKQISRLPQPVFCFSYYKTLGVNETASQLDIQKAYSKLYFQYQPKRTPHRGNVYYPEEDTFSKIIEAYSVLSVKELRNEYNAEFFPEIYHKVLEMNNITGNRDKSGSMERTKIMSPQQQERVDFLARERKKFNVDKFGRYKGGLPIRNLGKVKRNIWGGAGLDDHSFAHSEQSHQQDEEMTSGVHPHEQRVSNLMANRFSEYKFDSSVDLLKYKTYFIADINHNWWHFTMTKGLFKLFRNIFLLMCLAPGPHFDWNVWEQYFRTKNQKVEMAIEKATTSEDVIKIFQKNNLRYDIDTGIIIREDYMGWNTIGQSLIETGQQILQTFGL